MGQGWGREGRRGEGRVGEENGESEGKGEEDGREGDAYDLGCDVDCSSVPFLLTIILILITSSL